MQARVIFVSHASKRISLSLRPHLVSGVGFSLPSSSSSADASSSSNGFQHGDRVQARVLRVDNSLGLLLELFSESSFSSSSSASSESKSDEDDSKSKKSKKKSKLASQQSADSRVYGYCHISHVNDSSDKIENLSTRYDVGAGPFPARVLFTHTLDGLLNVSLRPSVLAQTVLGLDDVKPGMKIDGEIGQIVDAGLVVKLTSRMTALCPVPHWSDVTPTTPAAKKKAVC